MKKQTGFLIVGIVLVTISEVTMALDVTFSQKQLDIPEIIQLQKSMSLSANPKQLSAKPIANCFEANIDAFIP